jgi:hypothetical protein
MAVPLHRSVLVVCAALLLLAGACTSGDTKTASDGSTTTQAGSDSTVPSGPAPGVTADAIKVGVTYLDLSSIQNIVDIDLGDFVKAYKPLFDDINEHGGIHGRKLEPIFAPVSPIGTAPLEAACLKLTEDDKVFVVTGSFRDTAPSCYLETHKTAILGGPINNDLLARTSPPWFSAGAGDDFQADVIRKYAKDGRLGKKLGVFAIRTEADLLNKVALPVLEEEGIKPLQTAILDAPANDLTAQNNAVKVIAEKFRSSGVNQVLIVGSGGITWGNGVESTDYRPQLLFVDKAAMEAWVQDKGGHDLSILKGAEGMSLDMPAEDVYHYPGMQRCYRIQAAAGYTTPDPATLPAKDVSKIAAANTACGDVALLKAILERAGRNLNYGTLEQAGEQLGKITLPGSPHPYHFGPPPATDGNPVPNLYEWNAGKKQFVLASKD